MSRSVSVSDSFPRSAVFFVAVGRAFIFVVGITRGFPVFLTIRFIGEPSASGVSARAFRFARHRFTSLSAHKERPTRICPHEPLSVYTFSLFQYSTYKAGNQVNSTAHFQFLKNMIAVSTHKLPSFFRMLSTDFNALPWRMNSHLCP